MGKKIFTIFVYLNLCTFMQVRLSLHCFADAISTKILCAGPYHIYSNICMGLCFRSHNNYLLIAKMANYAKILISLVISAWYSAIFYQLQYIWGSTRENLSSEVSEQQRHRPACAFGQSDQRLCYSLFGKYHI